MMPLAGLAIFSGLSLNLLLQFALGTKDIAGDRTDAKKEVPVIQIGFLFLSVFFLWILFNRIMPVFWRGFSVYFLYFPVSALVCIGLEFMAQKVLPKINPKAPGMKKKYSSYTAYDGLVPAALVITLLAAGTFAGAFVLSLFFAIGNLVSMLILNEIRRRSVMEWVPRYLRGSPLTLISMGLLSLIFTSAAGICFKILEAF
jgi:electron transport complex protein RnfA